MIRHLLIRAYPRRWRHEFGPELADILAFRKLSPALIGDVLLSAAVQHLRQDPWKICALGLAVWTAGLLITASAGLIKQPAFGLCYFAGQMFVLGAGAWTGLRERCGVWRATAASAKAAVLPAAACVALSGIRMLHAAANSREIYGRNISHWVWKNVLFAAFLSLLFGLAGASLARLVNRLRRAAPTRP